MKKNNIYIFIVSVILSVILWIYLSLNLTYNISIPFHLKIYYNNNRALTGDIPSKLNVSLKGKGWDILTYILTKDREYVIDLSNIRKDTKIYTNNDIYERMDIPYNISVNRIEPDTIHINFDNVIEKYFKVKNNITLKFKEGFRLIGQPEIIPDSVKVKGANSVLSKIKLIPTETKLYDNINESFTTEIKLINEYENMIEIQPVSVKVIFDVELSAEKIFEDIDIRVINIPSDREVLIAPPKLSVSLRGGVEQLSRINISGIIARVDFRNIEKDTMGYVIPEIEVPENLEIISINPQKFQYIIKNRSNEIIDSVFKK